MCIDLLDKAQAIYDPEHPLPCAVRETGKNDMNDGNMCLIQSSCLPEIFFAAYSSSRYSVDLQSFLSSSASQVVSEID